MVLEKVPWNFIYNLLVAENFSRSVPFVCRDGLAGWCVCIANDLYISYRRLTSNTYQNFNNKTYYVIRVYIILNI